MKLQDLNPHPRDNQLFFDEKPHIYYVDGEKVGKSVTTLIHDYFPHFNSNKIAPMVQRKNFNNRSSQYYQK